MKGAALKLWMAKYGNKLGRAAKEGVEKVKSVDSSDVAKGLGTAIGKTYTNRGKIGVGAGAAAGVAASEALNDDDKKKKKKKPEYLED